jgi:uncharacterized protein with HEPN domain
VSRDDRQRLDDIIDACDVIAGHLGRGDLSDGLVFDAVRMRLVEVGEAVKSIDADLLASEPDIPWSEVARMRDLLTHRYFDTLHSIVEHTAKYDLVELRAAVIRMTARLSNGAQPGDA